MANTFEMLKKKKKKRINVVMISLEYEHTQIYFHTDGSDDC